MKLLPLATLLLPFLAPIVSGHPKLGKLMHELQSRAGHPSEHPEFDSHELIGDLKTIGPTTKVGHQISDLLQGEGNPESHERWWGWTPRKGSWMCRLNPCCIWKHVADDMANHFRGEDGRCNGLARQAVRLGFHDAGTWDNTSTYGGADGSIILSSELSAVENMGLDKIGRMMRYWGKKYSPYGVGMADLIQMSANVATVVCPLGPRIRTYVGRKDNSRANNVALLPDVRAPAQELIDLFMRKTIGPHGLVALVGAHTTSQQSFVDPSKKLAPQDSTPGIWDVLFYPQTIGTVETPSRVFKFPSDIALAAHPTTSKEWRDFAGPGGQEHWNEDYAMEYIRLSLLGVNNINGLTECTKVLPRAIASFDTSRFSSRWFQWLGGLFDNLSQSVEDGIGI